MFDLVDKAVVTDFRRTGYAIKRYIILGGVVEVVFIMQNSILDKMEAGEGVTDCL